MDLESCARIWLNASAEAQRRLFAGPPVDVGRISALLLARCETDVVHGVGPAFVSGRVREPARASCSLCPKAAASRAGEGGRRSAVGPADPRVQPEHRQGLMTISMPDRFRLAAPRGRRRPIGMAMGLVEQSRLASCPRPGRTKSTPLTRRRIAVWRLEWPPRVARARRDGRDGSCASGRPRDVGHRCERWRALERERGAAFEPPLASQVLLGIKQLEPNGQVLLRRPDCVRGHSGPPGVGGLPSAY